MITVDIPANALTVAVAEDDMAARGARWVKPEPKIKTGVLARYAKLVSSGMSGAVLK